MNTFELKGTTPAGKTGVVYACGVCEHAARDRETADSCCAPGRCEICGGEIPSNRLRCDPCNARASAEREAKRIADAPRVLEANAAMLYCDCCETFFSDSSEMLDDHHRHERDLPAHAWACDPVAFSLDADEIIERELKQQEFNEDTQFEKAELDDLQVVLDAWCSRYGKRNFFANNSIVDLTDAREAFLAIARRSSR